MKTHLYSTLEPSHVAPRAPFYHRALPPGQREQELKQDGGPVKGLLCPYELSLKEVLSCPTLPPNVCVGLQKADVLYYGWSPYLKESNQC